MLTSSPRPRGTLVNMGLGAALGALVVESYRLIAHALADKLDGRIIPAEKLWIAFPVAALTIAVVVSLLARRLALSRPITWSFGVVGLVAPLLPYYYAYASSHYILRPDLAASSKESALLVLVIGAAFGAFSGVLIGALGSRFESSKPWRTRVALGAVAIGGVVLPTLAIVTGVMADQNKDGWLCAIASLSEAAVVLALFATRKTQGPPDAKREGRFDTIGGAFFGAAGLLVGLAPLIPPGKATMGRLPTVNNRFFHPLLQDEQTACSGGDAWACDSLARFYLDGRGTAKDPIQARKYADMSCQLGDREACAELGRLIYDDMGNWGSDETANAAFRKSCDLGFASGCLYLGQILDGQLGGDSDTKAAAQAFLKSCAGGSDPGCAQYGLALLSGRGLVADRTKAEAILVSACERRTERACTFSAEDKVTLTSQKDPFVAFELGSDHIFWVESRDAMKYAFLTISKSGGAPRELAVTEQLPMGLAADEQHVYWFDTGAVRRVSTTGGNIEDISANSAAALAIDDTYVYWTAPIAQTEPDLHWSAGAGIVRRSKSGGPTETVFADAKSSPSQVLAVDGSRVYWARADNTVMQIAKDGSGRATEVVHSTERVMRIKLTNDDILWLSQSGVLTKTPKSGGDSVVVAKPTKSTITAFASDGTRAFACAHDKTGSLSGWLDQYAEDQTEPTHRWRGLCMHVATDGNHAYFSDGMSIFMIAE